jgi:hypothetical protein
VRARIRPVSAFSGEPVDGRAQRKVDAATAWAEAVRVVGASDAALGAELGVSPTVLRRYGRGEAMPPLADVRGLPLAGRLSIARSLVGEDDFAVVRLPKAAVRRDALLLAATAQGETGKALSLHLEVTSHGFLTRCQAAELERRVDAAIAPLLSIRELARTAKREGVLSIEFVDRELTPGERRP